MASWVGRRSSATKSQLDELVRAIRRTPIVDNHAHPLLKPGSVHKHPLLSITSEASGDAIDDTPTSLAHLRAVRQLSAVLRCEPTWEAVVAAVQQRRIDDADDWNAFCLAGVETILVDDGLDSADDVLEYSEHDDFTRAPCKRIVRIEHVAQQIISHHVIDFLTAEGKAQGKSTDDLFDIVLEDFEKHIAEAVGDEEVVGFKSVICYRTGLGIAPAVDIVAARRSFEKLVAEVRAEGEFLRLQHAHLNDLVVHRTAELIRDSKSRQKRPLQFHVGLGDSDVTLIRASPSHLQEFIRAYPAVPIVLLHASYPFTREAGYLATVYKNVYADIGEVFPFISKGGQEDVLRQVLELCPWSKILWSTDGHWFPETYLLAVMQVRECLEVVLCDYVRQGQIGWKAAVELTRDILYRNSNKLYHLGLEFSELDDHEARATPLAESSFRSDLDLFEAFLEGRGAPDFVRIQWNDFTAMPRMRMIPFRKFLSLLHDGKPTDIGITKASLALLQNDTLATGGSGTGEYRLHPDFASIQAGPIAGHVSLNGEFREKDGSKVNLCPRSLLQRAVELAAGHGIKYICGFEIEFLLVERVDPGTSSELSYRILTNDGHCWSAANYFADTKIATLLRDMVAELAAMDIHVEQLHAEGSPGQFELILPPLPPVEAVDTLLHVRQVMTALATAAGLRMTLHPKPFAHTPGTAAHMHMSISSSGGDRPEVYEPFYAGILKHLPAILAFAYSNPASYERSQDGCWAGGRWVTWGTQNRETALRKIEGSHWELKCLDGVANPYLALGALFLAGTHGIMAKEKLVWRDCEIDPAALTDNDRKELRVTTRLPASVEEALTALKDDAEMVEWLTADLVDQYVNVKESELKLLGEMGKEELRQWIMARY